MWRKTDISFAMQDFFLNPVFFLWKWIDPLIFLYDYCKKFVFQRDPNVHHAMASSCMLKWMDWQKFVEMNESPEIKIRVGLGWNPLKTPNTLMFNICSLKEYPYPSHTHELDIQDLRWLVALHQIRPETFLLTATSVACSLVAGLLRPLTCAALIVSYNYKRQARGAVTSQFQPVRLIVNDRKFSAKQYFSLTPNQPAV